MRCGLAHFVSGQTHRRDGWADQLSKWSIVIANNGNVIRNAQSCIRDGVYCAECHPVAGREDRGRTVGYIQQLSRGVIPTGQLPVAFCDVAIVNVNGLEISQNIHFGRQTAHPATGAQAAFWDFVRVLEPELFDFSEQEPLPIKS